MGIRFFYIFCIFISIQLFAKDIDQEKNLKKELEIIDANIQGQSNNIWMKKYANFENYNLTSNEINRFNEELKKIRLQPRTPENYFKAHQLENQIETLQRRLELLSVDKENPFKELLRKPEIDPLPEIKNPFAIIAAIGFKNNLETKKRILNQNHQSLKKILELFKKKYDILEELRKNKYEIENMELYKLQARILELESADNILDTTIEIFSKNVEEVKNRILAQVKNQIFKSIYIAIAIMISFGIAFIFKVFARKYIQDNERAYLASKVINILNITIIVLMLLFAYLENVTYLVTFLGFASAGLAIAMKDLFMSILGWFVIMIGGSVHVGDRIRVTKDGSIYVGDVLDISVLRITLYEDVTLTTMENRRAGRIIFIPNNYIFTTMFSNYTHGGMKTVWDGIDFTITFDSNISKATEIAIDIANKYAKGYTESTRRQLSRMRNRYALKNSNVEPKVFTLIENNGVRVSVWFQSNAYATLGLRSMISMEIIERLLKEPDIRIAYTTTKLVKDGLDGFGNKYAHQFPIET